MECFCDAPLVVRVCKERLEYQSCSVSRDDFALLRPLTLMTVSDLAQLVRQNSALDCRRSNSCALSEY